MTSKTCLLQSPCFLLSFFFFLKKKNCPCFESILYVPSAWKTRTVILWLTICAQFQLIWLKYVVSWIDCIVCIIMIMVYIIMHIIQHRVNHIWINWSMKILIGNLLLTQKQMFIKLFPFQRRIALHPLNIVIIICCRLQGTIY